jgi:hypothetical protein
MVAYGIKTDGFELEGSKLEGIIFERSKTPEARRS